MDSQFDVDWFKSFNIVFNALDNLAARRHVNHMCLAAGVPLVESGTTGFNGQVQVIEGVSRIDDREKTTTLLKTLPIPGQNGMLRLQSEASLQVLPNLHHPKHPVTAHPLHSMGKKLSPTVRCLAALSPTYTYYS